MSQFQRAKELFKKQLEKVRNDIARNPEIRSLADAQFFDDANSEHQYPRYYVMPESNKSNWKHLDTHERAVYVMCKSRAFTFQEIAVYLKIGEGEVGEKRVRRLYKKIALSIQ